MNVVESVVARRRDLARPGGGGGGAADGAGGGAARGPAHAHHHRSVHPPHVSNVLQNSRFRIKQGHGVIVVRSFKIFWLGLGYVL